MIYIAFEKADKEQLNRKRLKIYPMIPCLNLLVCTAAIKVNRPGHNRRNIKYVLNEFFTTDH